MDRGQARGDEMNAANFDKLSAEEKAHFYQCAKCGEFVDKRELRDVIFHETHNRDALALPRIIEKPHSETSSPRDRSD